MEVAASSWYPHLDRWPCCRRGTTDRRSIWRPKPYARRGQSL